VACLYRAATWRKAATLTLASGVFSGASFGLGRHRIRLAARHQYVNAARDAPKSGILKGSASSLAWGGEAETLTASAAYKGAEGQGTA
jgi:hypothetical protein